MLPKPTYATSPRFLDNLPPLYASQTKILENETAGRACLFEVLCEGVSTGFGLLMLAKSLEKTRPTCCSVFQNLRLGCLQWGEHFVKRVNR